MSRPLDFVPLRSFGIALVAHDADDILDELASLFARPAWQAPDLALCTQHPEIDFFPDRSTDTRRAKALCGRCVVRTECLTFALEHDDTAGIWGGTSRRERASIRAGRTSVDDALARTVNAPAPRVIKPRPQRVVRSGSGNCDACNRRCAPTKERPHNRLVVGLCPACHQAWRRWSSVHDGDRWDFIRQRAAA